MALANSVLPGIKVFVTGATGILALFEWTHGNAVIAKEAQQTLRDGPELQTEILEGKRSGQVKGEPVKEQELLTALEEQKQETGALEERLKAAAAKEQQLLRELEEQKQGPVGCSPCMSECL